MRSIALATLFAASCTLARPTLLGRLIKPRNNDNICPDIAKLENAINSILQHGPEEVRIPHGLYESTESDSDFESGSDSESGSGSSSESDSDDDDDKWSWTRLVADSEPRRRIELYKIAHDPDDCSYAMRDVDNDNTAENTLMVTKASQVGSFIPDNEAHALMATGVFMGEDVVTLPGETGTRHLIHAKYIWGVHPTQTTQWSNIVSRKGALRRDQDKDIGKCLDYMYDLFASIARVRVTYRQKFGVDHGPIAFTDILVPTNYQVGRESDNQMQLTNWQGSSPQAFSDDVYQQAINDLMAKYDAQKICQ